MKLTRLVCVLVASFVCVGCASQSDVRAAKEEVMRDVTDANRTAEEALAMAREAKQLAQEANSRSQRSEEMLNRGFKRSMYK